MKNMRTSESHMGKTYHVARGGVHGLGIVECRHYQRHLADAPPVVVDSVGVGGIYIDTSWESIFSAIRSIIISPSLTQPTSTQPTF